jgi:hypothetical protein
VPQSTTWLAAVHASNEGRARTRPSARRAPLPWSPLGRGRPDASARPLTGYTLGRGRPMAVRAPTFAPHEAFAPPFRASRDVRAHGSRSRPTAWAPLEYKFIKIVVHSTTWASRPSTTMRWMTAGCLGGDHLFLIHSHGPRAHPQTRLYACLI